MIPAHPELPETPELPITMDLVNRAHHMTAQELQGLIGVAEKFKIYSRRRLNGEQPQDILTPNWDKSMDPPIELLAQLFAVCQMAPELVLRPWDRKRWNELVGKQVLVLSTQQQLEIYGATADEVILREWFPESFVRAAAGGKVSHERRMSFADAARKLIQAGKLCGDHYTLGGQFKDLKPAGIPVPPPELPSSVRDGKRAPVVDVGARMQANGLNVAKDYQVVAGANGGEIAKQNPPMPPVAVPWNAYVPGDPSPIQVWGVVGVKGPGPHPQGPPGTPEPAPYDGSPQWLRDLAAPGGYAARAPEKYGIAPPLPPSPFGSPPATRLVETDLGPVVQPVPPITGGGFLELLDDVDAGKYSDPAEAALVRQDIETTLGKPPGNYPADQFWELGKKQPQYPLQ